MNMTEEEFQQLFNRIDNGFVGSEQHVYEYQRPFANYFKGVSPVLDIGCGQGAFLKALDELNIDAIGLDLDTTNCQSVINKGYSCLNVDAFSYLEYNKSKHGGISMFHMIEHFDGETAVRLLVLIYESLKKDGVFCLLTPDFNQVGNHNFWLSSTHVRPYPLAWLENALSEIGFSIVDKGNAIGGDTFIVAVKEHD